MKDFFKYVLATVVGLIVVGLLCGLMMVISLIGMASGSANSSVPKNAVVVLKLNGSIDERTQDNPFSFLTNRGDDESLGLDNILKGIRNAKENENVKGLYLEAGSLSGATPAMLQEIRQALVDFKTSDKFIVSYGEQYTQGCYYLCSVADTIVINPQGMLDWKGLAMQTTYFKELMDKLGVKMEIFKVGTYKSAVEPYFLNEMSEANREQMTVFCDEIWNQMLSEVSTSRGMSTDKLNALTDSGLTFQEAELYMKLKLVDKLAYTDEVPRIIANMMQSDKENPKDAYNTISINDMAATTANEPKGTSGNIIAVYYANGEIVDEEAGGLGSFNQEDMIVGHKTVKALQELADDEDVKAVVLRVNSPGGSAYASEQIWHQVMNIKSKKPIIVSMGGYAASGGYYISCAADWIVAEPTTLTGSIGIFGTFPVAEELLTKIIGVHFSTVKTNEYADFGDFSRQMTEGEKNLLQNYVNRGYELFTKRCADGRGMKQDDIKAIAEGRVWTGEHAIQIGLVDQLGNLDDAIAEAKKRAEGEEFTVLTYPAKSNFLDELLEETKGSSYADAQLREVLGDYYGFFRSLNHLNRHGNVQAQLPYYISFNL